MEITPNTGPGAKIINAYRQLLILGTSSIETFVNKNPTHICIVSAVPTYCGSPSSVTHEENCAESATTVAPQIAATINNNTGLPPYNNPITRQHVPLIAIAHDVTSVLPTRSAINPAMTHPIAPAPITMNDPTSANSGLAFCIARLERIITGIHTHMPYSSHM